MTIKKVQIDRFSVISSKPFEVIVAALEAAVGHSNMVEFVEAAQCALTFAELKNVIDRSLGRTGLMMFMKFDLGAILRRIRAQQAESCAFFNRQSAHYERNGKACSRCWIIPPVDNFGRRAARRRAFVV